MFWGQLTLEARVEITTGRWFKGQEKVGWGEGSEAVVAKNRFMERLRSLGGRRGGYWYYTISEKGNEDKLSSGLGGAVGGSCLRL